MSEAQTTREMPPAKTAQHAWPFLTALVFFALSLVWAGRDLDFSAFAHPDERNKINQIIEQRYDFHHPLLLLNTVRLSCDLAGSKGFEAVKLAGRRASVVFTSAAAALLVLLVGRIYGRLVALAAGCFLLSNPHIFDVAHYFKEDPALLFGLALSLVAMLVHCERPGFSTATFLGIANACAVSGKYAGALVIPFSIYIIWATSGSSRARHLIVFFAALAAGFVLINLPALSALHAATGSLDREVGLLTGSRKGISRSVPHGVYSNVYWGSSTPFLVALLGLFAYELYRRGSFRNPVEKVLVAFPLLYIAVLSFIPRTHFRYFLPVAALLACLSAAGLLPLLRLKNGKLWAACVVVLSIAWQAPRLYAANRGFKEDHRTELLNFVETRLPPDAVLLQDQNIDMPESEKIRIIRRKLGSGDSLDSLRAEGVTHVVVAESKYGKFFNSKAVVNEWAKEDFEKTKRFFVSLFSEADLLWEWQVGDNLYLAPSLRIYSINKHALGSGGG